MHSSLRRAAPAYLAAFLLCCLAGCYDKSIRGDQSVYRFAWWIGVGVILGGLAFIPVGWFLRRVTAKWSFVLMAMSPVLLIIVAPAIYSDKVVVDAEHFEARYGLWFSPSVHNIRFDGLEEIRYVGTRNNRGEITYQLQCVHKGGNVEAVSVGDLVVNAVPDILSRAEARKLRVIRQP